MTVSISGEKVSDHNRKQANIPESCPHCDRGLSSWEQVLLNIDGALICKNCWYRIFLTRIGNDDYRPP